MTSDASAAVLAVDLGGTHMRCAVVSSGGEVLAHQVVDTPHDATGPGVLAELAAAVLKAGAAAGASGVVRGVVGVPGRVDYSTGRLEHAPNLDSCWSQTGWPAELAQQSGLTLSLANDADLAAVGEASFGAGSRRGTVHGATAAAGGAGVGDLVYLTVSTGVGAGAVIGGRLVAGTRSLLEIGHTIIDIRASRAGEPATVEELGSGTALGRLGAAAGVGGTAPEVLRSVRDGEPGALDVWQDVIAVICAAAVNLSHLLCPQLLVIGGGLGLNADLIHAPVRDALARSGPQGLPHPIEVLSAQLGDDAGLIGAAGWAAAAGALGLVGR